MKKAILTSVRITLFCGARLQSPTAQIIQIDGSSTVFPITEAVAEEFQKAQEGQDQSNRRHRRHRWRIQEVLPRRN